jgi:amidohydrolase
MTNGTTIRSRINDILPELIAFRRDLHAHPELGYDEHRTSQTVQTALQEAGVEHVGGLAGGTGVLGHIPGTASNAIGLRADMDALPIDEQTGLEWASTHEGCMHACGHDGHTAILVGAARVLGAMAAEGTLPNPVNFLFQPAEEGGGGGKRMVEDGCLDGRVLGPDVSRMYGLHGWPTLPQGMISSRPGAMLAAADRFDVTITGLGGHAAMPHTTRDPIVAAAAVVQALQSIVARNVDPVQGAVVSVTMINSGSAFNIIPEVCTLAGTVRALHEEAMDTVRARLNEVVRDVAAAHGCQAQLEYHEGYPVTRNDPREVEIVHDTARKILGEDLVQVMDAPVMGAEDFSYYCQEVPSCFFALGLLPADRDSMPLLHHPCFDFNDDVIATGVELFCTLALNEQPSNC